jgi:hypothetical protein
MVEHGGSKFKATSERNWISTKIQMFYVGEELGSQKPKGSINMHAFSTANLCQSLVKCQKPVNHWYGWHCQSLKKVSITDQKNDFGKLSIFDLNCKDSTAIGAQWKEKSSL